MSKTAFLYHGLTSAKQCFELFSGVWYRAMPDKGFSVSSLKGMMLNVFICTFSFGHVRDQLSWLSKKMDESLNNLANKMEQLEHRTATEHAQLTAAVEQSRKGAWQYSDRMRGVLEEQISNLEKVSKHFITHVLCNGVHVCGSLVPRPFISFSKLTLKRIWE